VVFLNPISKMCSPKGCCGPFTSILISLMVLTALCTPWIFRGAALKNASDEIVCSTMYLEGWDRYYCGSSDTSNTVCTSVSKLLLCPADTGSWRDEDCGGNTECTKLFNLNNAAATLSAISLLCIVICTVLFFVRCCGNPKPGRHAGLITFSLIGFGALLIAVVAFAVANPQAQTQAHSTDLLGFCSSTYCDKFWGVKEISVAGYTTYYIWGPIGWAIASLALVFWMFMLCCAFASVPSTTWEQAQLSYAAVQVQDPRFGNTPYTLYTGN